jgi:5'/3'-nucleotidase
VSARRILVTNDDGVTSEGIVELARELSRIAEVTTVAPDRERSAAGHSLTLDHPLRATRLSERRFVVDGTPTDCVHWAVHHLMRSGRPDLIVSGINFGLNVGDDVTYSGTVSAAFEGTIIGIPSVAISQQVESGFSFSPAARLAREIASDLLDHRLSAGTLLNVNVPSGEISGLRVTRLGKRIYKEEVVEKRDPRGRPYYWIGAGVPEGNPEEGTDLQAIAEGFVSLTPLHLDLTHYQAMDELRATVERLSRTVEA